MGADGGLEEWAAGSDRRRPGGWPRGYLLFAFYGRVSTEDWHDPASSLARQREQAGALVSEPDFVDAQQVSAARGPDPRNGRPAAPDERRYPLAGLLTCGTCGRRMESSWSNGKAAYRCRHGHTSAAAPNPVTPRTPTSARTGRWSTCPPCT
jgi:Recombinase zinc beta ribbon domain